jgi:hypothetical protein
MTGAADQLAAAVADVTTAGARFTLERGIRPRRVTEDQACPWALSAAKSILAGYRAGTAPTCLHLTGTSPRPIWAAAWADRIVCSRCVDTLRPPRTLACDRCANSGADLGISVLMIQAGYLVLSVRVCHRCRHDALPPPRHPRHHQRRRKEPR